jgi:hypothetical protein
MAVIGEPVVVEFFQSGPTDVEASRQTAHLTIRFEHLDSKPASS